MKFYQNPSTGSRVVTDGQTVMTKLIVGLRNFANARKNYAFSPHGIFTCFYVSLNNQRLFPYAGLTYRFYNRVGVCLLRGANGIFIRNLD
jgi:hypothetical protein